MAELNTNRPNDQMPKKNPFSMQLDLSKFELATDEEKAQQDRMRESTSFLKDSLRRLRKDKLSMTCLIIVVLLTFTAFIVPLFYPYDYSTSSGNRDSIAGEFLGPFEYSMREKILMSENAVFMGWAHGKEDISHYYGLLVIDSEEYLNEVKEYFVTDTVTFGDATELLYAVWGVDADGDGVGDYGADLFNYDESKNVISPRYKLTYDLNGGSGTVPTDDFGYVPADKIVPSNETSDFKKDGAVFAGWTAEGALPVLDASNFGEYGEKIISKNFSVSSDTVLYAVWAADADGDGNADEGVEVSYRYNGKGRTDRYRLTYDGNMSVESAPVDSNTYAAGDIVTPTAQKLTKQSQSVFPHILGTDELGRDYAIRIIVGTRVSLLVGIIAAVVVVIIGVLYGAISGYFGGKVDLVMMRIVDIIYSLPDTLIIILLSVAFKDIFQNGPLSSVVDKLGGVGLVSILIVFALLYWVGMARLVRGQVLSLREQEFVLAAKACDAPARWIIFKHMLPNCISVIFISAALQIPSAIFTESFLSYLGIGVSIPMPSLGSLASNYRGQMTIEGRGYLFILPAIIIFLLVLSLNLLGQGLRDAFDPKLREKS